MIVAIICSAALTWLTILGARHLRLGNDESSGVQKFHSHQVARLGGLPIFVTLCGVMLLDAWLTGASVDIVTRFIVCILPAFGIGLLEDITRGAGVLSRLAMTMVSAALAFWLLDGRLTRLDLPLVDTLLVASPFVCLLLTMFAAGGVAHAVNIIDGYNGLSAFFVIAAFTAIGLIAGDAGDSLLSTLSLLSAACVAGFMLWNFPYGRIFLGDSGAYMLGFMLAELSILVVHRNPSVSAWALLLVMLYPIWETVFSMSRRFRKGFSEMFQPDALHLHQLVYGRILKRYVGSTDPKHLILRNSFTSLYLWVLILLSMVPAVLFYRDTRTLLTFVLIFVATYQYVYVAIVRFRVPMWVVARPVKTEAKVVASPTPEI